MNWKRHIAEAATLIGAAILCALTANALASRERKLALVAPGAPTLPAVRAPRVADRPPEVVATANEPAPVAPAPAPVTINRQPATAAKPKPSTDNRQPTTPAKPAKQFKPHPDKPYIEISHSDVAALKDAGALFLDARRTSVYEQGHIAGARPFSVWESDVDDKVNKLFAERSDPRDQEKPIVIYCSGGDCEDSHMLAQKLWGIQFNNLYVYKDGFPDWQKHGGASHTGANP